ncbi:hypothetical protein SLS64_007066 [Diaporthe eres]|uniref:2EXR domain-containing protein n=1 Tax=Diaporthe eres TaxID=83184 RepID=A0ABR1PGV3_DIAER
MSSAPAKEFPRFLDLPFEIRWAIYKLCLPTRVINSEIRNLRPVPKYSINREERLALRRIVAKFGRTPVIARASPEVYRKLQQHVVALPHSEWVWSWRTSDSDPITEGFTDPRPIIFDPMSDVLLASPGHWVSGEDDEMYLDRSPYCLASSRDVAVAIDDQTIHYLSICKWLADYCFLGRKNCTIVLSETKLVNSSEWIASCGLFGLFGEEQTVLVDVDDSERIEYFDRKLNGQHMGGPVGLKPTKPNATGGIRRYSSHGNVDFPMKWNENTPLVSAEDRAEVIAQDKEEIVRQVKQHWLEVNGCFRGTELDNPSFVPSEGGWWGMVFDEEHPNAKAWLDKLPAFSFAVRVHAHDFEEETMLLYAKRARLRGGNGQGRWADMPLSVAAFSWTNW